MATREVPLPRREGRENGQVEACDTRYLPSRRKTTRKNVKSPSVITVNTINYDKRTQSTQTIPEGESTCSAVKEQGGSDT